MNYGERLKELRLDKGLRQEDVAEVLKISRSTYKDYEGQISIIPIKHLIRLADYYHVPVNYLLGFVKEKAFGDDYKVVTPKKAGERLVDFRKTEKLKQESLAKLLNTTFSSIAFNEKGRNIIATSFLYTICKEYKVSADYLLGRVDEPMYLEEKIK